MSELKRVGVFGGTFDPIHNTHLDIARAALAHAQLDSVLFVVSACPPHKEEGPRAAAEDRYALVQAALADEPSLQASRIEIDRAGPSYTRDTLRELKRRYPDATLFLIIGLDSLIDLPHWKAPGEILALARLLVVPRSGQSGEVAPELRGRYDVLPFKESALSSTEIRSRIAAGKPFGDLVPPAVERLIREKRIYHARPGDGPR